MKGFFDPKTVALIGATDKLGRPGRNFNYNLQKSFGDRYFPVNPRGGEFEGGVKVYRNVSEIPVPVELALTFISAENTPQAIEECARAGIKRVIIESGGFAETGANGKAIQDRVVEIARANDMRIWGPNCMGIINASKRYVMSFMLPRIWDDDLLVAGDIALVVQSGMLSAGFLIAAMGKAKFGLSKVCSIGNKADVDELDALEYLLDDPETNVISMYLESIKNGRRLLDLLKNTDKTVIALKGGTTRSGAKAAASHTASMAGNAEIVEAALKQANVIRVNGFYDLLDVARSVSRFGRRPAQAARIAIMTFSGAAGIVSSDMIENAGMKIAEFSQETVEKLKPIYPPWMPPENPCDLYPATEIHGIKAYTEGIRIMLEAPEVDAIFIHMFAYPLAGIQIQAAFIEEWGAIAQEKKKPMVAWLMGDPEASIKIGRMMEERGISVLNDIDRAVGALRAIFSRREAVG